MGKLGPMGIMAGRTFISLQGSMNIRLIQTYLFFAMARITNLIPFFLKENFGNQPMPQVAVLTFFLFDDWMHILHSQILIGKLFVAIQALFLRKPPSRGCTPPQSPLLGCLCTGI
jgi:hypothetical protein